MPNIVVLYTELADYTIQCFNTLAEDFGIQIFLVRYNVNKEAPFDFSQIHPGIKLLNKDDFDEQKLNEFIADKKPELIYCAGWSDKLYLSAIKSNYKNYKTVLGFDNQWLNTVKQNIARIVFPFTITKYFNYCFVPGELQVNFAKKIGFKPGQIITGAYSCDFNYFNSLYQNFKAEKFSSNNKRFIYVGRYYDFKGVKELWKAFIELHSEFKNDWELWCLGIGDIKPIEHPKIKHFGFVQPKDIEQFIKQTDVFILPSIFEPWSVAVHEYASAGFPLLLSDAVGARVAFLNKENGFSFAAGNISSIKEAMKKIISLRNNDLQKMGEVSNELAGKITPGTWAASLNKIIVR